MPPEASGIPLLQFYLEYYNAKLGPAFAYRKIPLGGPGMGAWPEDGGQWRARGVLFPAVEGFTPKGQLVNAGKPGVQKAVDATQGQPVEVVEGGPHLDRALVGRAMVSCELFERQHRPERVRATILVSESDGTLQWFCARHGIRVVLVDQRGAAGVRILEV